MLTLFLIQSGEKSNTERAKESFGDVELVTHIVGTVQEINSIHVNTDWYFVLHDNEYLSEDMKDSLPSYIANEEYDVFTMMKRFFNDDGELSGTESPRMYRQDILLTQDSLMPQSYKKCQRILDGWVLDDKSIL